MKMFLTRLGQNSKAVITGDITQIDLPNAFSGLVHVLPILSDIKGISICKFTDKDVMRHPLVKQIIKAYEKIMIECILINNINDQFVPKEKDFND